MTLIEDPTVADALRDLQITHGNPTPEELAIVAALVSATGQAGHAAEQADSGPPRSHWSDPARRLRQPLPAPAPGAWRTSALR